MARKFRQDTPLTPIINQINEWTRYILFKWKIIVLSILFGISFGYIKTIKQKVFYKATLTFILEDEKSNNSSGLGSLASQLGIDIPSNNAGMFSSSNIMGFMKSRFIIEKTLLNPVLYKGKFISYAELYLLNNKTRDYWAKQGKNKNLNFPPNADRSKFSIEQDIALYNIYTDLISSQKLFIGNNSSKSPFSILEISSENEFFAKSFCEELLKVTSQFYIDTKALKTQKNIQILQNKIDSVRHEYNSNIGSIAKASDDIYNLNPALKSKGTNPTKKQIDLQVNSTMLSSLISNLEMSKMSLLKEAPLFQIIDKPILPLERTEKNITKSIINGAILFAITTIIFLVLFRILGNILYEKNN